jgi:hypothetical protein
MTTNLETVRRRGASLIALTMAAAVLLMVGNSASAAIVATVPLATSANYAVLGGSTVTNTGASILNGSLGLSPGTSITGFPPGLVVPPGTTDATNAAAAQAQSDLTTAYVNAAGRPLNATTTADLGGKTLGAGVYAGPSKSPLGLTGKVTLDGAGDPSSVFVFQTDSTLITEVGSTVALINGAQECNVFWQVGSSATLKSGSVFVGNILALTSISVNNSVTVHGRALARNGAVTLDTDTFTKPTCATSRGIGFSTPTTRTTTATTGGSTTGGSTTGGTTATTVALPKTPIALTSGGPGVPGVVGPPRTGGGPLPTTSFPWLAVLFASLLGGAGTAGTLLSRRLHVGDAPSAKR